MKTRFAGLGLATFISLTLLTPSPSSSATDKLKVAVLDFKTVGDDAQLGEGAGEILRTTLVETGEYTIIERGMLNQVLEEQKLGYSGVVDQKEAASIGKMLGANLVAVGSVVRLGETYTLNIRFVDVQTGEVVSGRKLTAHSKDEIPALCGQMVKLLSGGKTPVTEKDPAIASPKEKPLTTSSRSAPGEWAVGLVYPGGTIKYLRGNNAVELKVQSGSGVLVGGPRYYHYLSNCGLRLFLGLEGDFLSFKGKESKGTGFAGWGFAGGEIPLGNNLGLSMDFGPMYIHLTDKDYSQSDGGIEYVLNMTLYWHFR
jgi:TolB-like protein